MASYFDLSIKLNMFLCSKSLVLLYTYAVDIKGTNCFPRDWQGLPRLLQLLTLLHVSDYDKFCNTERWKCFEC